jgi:phenylpropionate dioxygenase-like ring-hydroxylating dioxygenase large terminal subunit
MMDGSSGEFRPDRHPSESYDDILNRDTRVVPDHMRQGPAPDIGGAPIPVAHYTSPEHFEKEVKYVWSRCWQMACREEEIPNPGDYFIYENVGKSVIISRTASGEIKALHNVCLHRGRKLVTNNGCREEFRCPYHGFAWNNDGSFKENPIGWDFPQWKDRDMSLPEAKVETWGGFVFVNFDRNAKPLMHYLSPLDQHFKGYDYANRYKSAHVSKPVRCNWKALAEAFMESHHSITTHPQILPFLADANSQYDLITDYITRQFSASGVPSPFVADKNYTDDEIIGAMSGQGNGARRRGMEEGAVVPEGMTARAFAAEAARASMTAEDGRDYSACSDAEMVDALLYNLWPNMSFWAGYAPNLTYRWRPYGRDPNIGIMDVMILKPVPKDGPRPKPAPVHELGIDEPWSNATELGPGLCAIFEQDMGNLPYVQDGLNASENGEVHFGRYTEMRIRKLHQLIDEWIAAGEAGKPAP